MNLFFILLFYNFLRSSSLYNGGLGPRQPETNRYADQLTKNHVNLNPTTPTSPIQYDRFHSEPRRTIVLTSDQATQGARNLASQRERSHPFYERNKLFENKNPIITQTNLSPHQWQSNQNLDATQRGVNIQIGSSQLQAIDRFSTETDRFATNSNNANKVVLPVELANAPLERLLNKNTQVARTNVPQPEPLEANSRLLINPQQSVPPPVPDVINGQNPIPTTTPYPTYPDHRQEFFPKLANIWHEDRRPASGDRLGPQGRFGGGTNEYREDLGGINDRRMPWEKNPSSDLQQDKTIFEPLNKYSKNVAIETVNYPNAPPKEPSFPRYGDNKLISDPLGGLSQNRYGKEYAEFTTQTPQVPVKSSYIGVPLYPEYGTGYGGTRGTGPANDLINKDIVRPGETDKVQIPLSQHRIQQTIPSGDRPYYGPEEITRSRFRNIDQSDDLIINRHRHVKIDLLNE
ncbi:unnamed protein product [Bursaphelenchus xylophilus]|uniref:(pine wood nematode) hypothetical protein n=1 Tax=Bursaphelenchus xylophilus TaxID=6326 RepID=A0A1I7SVY9_BURXY|nr:unnamed protein product [Bursaphelenchus xylophilus]CAG9098521.1 unnamed protein product [Bursaphelenchus xylophilus]